LVSDFIDKNNLPIEIIGIDTVRENNGLALSSRNNHLNDFEKNVASNLFIVLNEIANNLDEIDGAYLDSRIENLKKLGFDVDYLTICDPISLSPIEGVRKKPLLIAVAASLNGIRLIDNLVVK
jgi:pantoate--beta-alanine ligase